ncbi:MAG: NYN domain-containing protein [Burkholderiaceae bacterium]|jgi:uncharacterized LabA/DUF88 family protein|nr:NYN domain-containing protein [Burkholderiaceae bacterium]
MADNATEKTARLAVLIDADNVSPSVIEALLEEIGKYGIATVRRIYGDWSSSRTDGWKKRLLDHSLQPVQQFPYTTGKNATDSALIIDAMDLLHGRRLDGFCLVSSDSDFTPLAARIRADGLPVYGFGESKTPKPFVAACTRFIYTDVITASREDAPKAPPLRSVKGDARLMNLLRGVIDDASDEDGWANLGDAGSRIVKQEPDFDPRNYGFSKLRTLFEKIDLFEVKERVSASGNKSLWVRNRRKSDPRAASAGAPASAPNAPSTPSAAPAPSAEPAAEAPKAGKRSRRGGRKTAGKATKSTESAG